MSDKLLSTANITMRFCGLTAVDHVTFNVFKDEILAIIGPNGAGKTTIFNMITGIYSPSEGTIKYEDKIINGLSPSEIAKIGIARTFQNSRLFSNLSVLDNVIIGFYSCWKTNLLTTILRRRLVRSELKQNIDSSFRLLATFSADLRDNAFKRASDLPQGDKRRLEICRALAADPDIVLLDEPSAGMDPLETRELMDDIRKLKQSKRGLGIILIEHDMSVVKGVADRVIVLSYGKIISEGTFEKISEDKMVQEAYLGRSTTAIRA